jgi:P2-related tail formation protein
MKFSVKVKLADYIIHENTYNSLKEICDELELTYQQVADISAKRRNKYTQKSSKYSPVIEINKIPPVCFAKP